MKPTGKQKRNADIYMRTLNKTEAGLGAYETESKQVAHNLTTRNLANPKVQTYIADTLDKVGLGDEMLGQSLKKIIKASTTRRSLKKTTPADGLRGIELTAKLKDRFPAERKQIEQVTLKLEGKSVGELQALLGQTIANAQKYRGLLNGEQQPPAQKEVVSSKESKVEDNKVLSMSSPPTNTNNKPRTKPITL